MKADGASRWFAIGAMLCGSIATMMTATIVNVALPSITGAFGLGQDQAQWMATAFLVASTGSMLLNTWVLGRFGVRLGLMTAMAVFLAGGITGLASHTYEMLVLARVLQGAGAGLVQPLAMYLLFRLFGEGERGVAIGLYALGVIVSPAFGPVIGGWLVESGGWRIVFVATAPLAALAFGLAPGLLPGREAGAPMRPLDWPGLAFAGLAVGLAMTGVATGHREGWTTLEAQARLALAGAAGLGLAWRGLTCPHPALDLRLFRKPAFAFAALVTASTGLAIYGSTYLFPVFVQLVQGYSPKSAGEILAPAGVLMAIAFPLAGRACDRVGPNLVLAPGVLAFGAAMFLLAGVSPDSSWWSLAGAIALSRLGIGAIMPSANAAVMRTARPEELAATSTAATFFTQTGGAFGVNGLAVFLQERSAFHAEALGAQISAAPDALRAALGELSGAMQAGGASADEAAARARAAIEALLARDALCLAFRDCFWLLGCGFLVIALLLGAGRLLAWSRAKRAHRSDFPAISPIGEA